ncbi:MAG: class I SAM-dependent methyltransferase [Patescibacteria group bacterium]
MAALEGAHWWFRGRRAVFLDVLRRYAPTGALLDVGLGTGANAAEFTRRGYAVTGLEPSTEAIAFAKEKVPDLRVIASPFPAREIEAGTFDIVVLLDVIEHLEDDAHALKEVFRILRPGGIVLVTTPAFMFLWSDHDALAHHYRRYRKGELMRKLHGAGLVPAMVSYYNFFLFPAIAAVRVAQNLLGVKKTESDFSSTPGFLNGMLATLFGAERFLLRLGPLPWGVSLIAVAKKP